MLGFLLLKRVYVHDKIKHSCEPLNIVTKATFLYENPTSSNDAFRLNSYSDVIAFLCEAHVRRLRKKIMNN